MKMWSNNHILDSIYAFVFVIDYHTHHIVYANRMMRMQYPDLQDESLCYQLVFGREMPCKDCSMCALLKGNTDVGTTMWSDVLQKWLQLQYNDYEEKGRHYCVCTGLDITAVKDSIHMTEKVLDGIRAAAYTIGICDYRLKSYNQELKNMLPAIENGQLCYESIWDKKEPCVFCPVQKLTKEQPYGNLELYNEKLGRYLSIDCVRVEGDGKEPVSIFTGYDITKSKQYEKELKNIAFRDVQLKVKNRTAYMDDLAHLFMSGKNGYSCQISIKNFNSYNLIYGRQQGDLLLKRLASYYSNFHNPEKVYRVGGAKFALLSDCYEECQCLLDKISKPYPQEVLENGHNFRLQVDAVVVEFPKYAVSPEVVIHNSEYMLQRTKKADTSEIMYFQKTEQMQLERNGQITAIIREKLKQNGFQVYFQPIYQIHSARFTKCEALLRLYYEELGWISPLEFIPIAEESGLISELGMVVLDQACRLIADRKKRGLEPIQVNVNVSTVQFSKTSFMNHVIDIVSSYDMDAGLIQLEVTESIMINSFEYIIEIMRKLIEFGISFAVDDFGTGYSSLSYIGTLPVESVKLDKSFIDRVTESEVYVLIVKNIIEIAKGLQFKIVAEGVESQNQLELLRKLGCDYIQGFLFSRPLPEKEFFEFLESNQ